MVSGRDFLRLQSTSLVPPKGQRGQGLHPAPSDPAQAQDLRPATEV